MQYLLTQVALYPVLTYNDSVLFVLKFIARVIVNSGVLYAAKFYFPGFVLTGSLDTLLLGGFFLSVLLVFVQPILRLISTPLVWVTFGLFNIVIFGVILWIADMVLVQLSITNLSTLFWVSIILAVANIIF